MDVVSFDKEEAKAKEQAFVKRKSLLLIKLFLFVILSNLKICLPIHDFIFP